jgi:hypothetical protein
VLNLKAYDTSVRLETETNLESNKLTDAELLTVPEINKFLQALDHHGARRGLDRAGSADLNSPAWSEASEWTYTGTADDDEADDSGSEEEEDEEGDEEGVEEEDE